MGVVYLVGAGPGAKGLLTVRGAALLGAADVVVPDAAIPGEALSLAREGARVEVAAGGAEAVAGRLVTLAETHAVVVRLLTGDGTTSERAGAELGLLEAGGVAWEVVPGVSPEAAAAAYAGVVAGPVPRLEAVRLGVEPEGTGAGAGSANGTAGVRLVVREAADAAAAAGALARAGLAGATRALVVRGAGTAAQTVTGATLAELAAGVGGDTAGPGTPGAASAGSGTAVLLTAGGTLPRVPWFERRPLFGRRVVVTRPRAQASDFLAWLETQGAEAVAFPAIRIVPPPDPASLAQAAAAVRDFDWLVFTSVNGVERFWEALAAAGLDARALGQAGVAAIGPATAAALRSRGIGADVVPERYVAESVVDALAAAGNLRGRRVLLPRAAGAREVLPQRLAELGALVTEVETYRAVPDAGEAAELRRRLADGAIDAVTFTSSSTVRNFVDAVGTELGGAAVACIGPVTADTARGAGLPVAVVAVEHTVSGLEAALLAHFGAQPELSA